MPDFNRMDIQQPQKARLENSRKSEFSINLNFLSDKKNQILKMKNDQRNIRFLSKYVI